MLEVSRSDIRIIQPYKNKKFYSNKMISYTNDYRRPSSFYNLTLISPEKAKKYLNISNNNIKSSYKTPNTNKSHKNIFFSKSPSQLSTMTPNNEQDKDNLISKGSGKNVSKINNRTRNFSSLQKKTFKSNSKKSSHQSSTKFALNNQEYISQNVKREKYRFNRSFLRSVRLSQCDMLIRGDFIPEEQRKKMLIDNIESIKADEEHKKIKNLFYSHSNKNKNKLKRKIDNKIKPIIKGCQNCFSSTNILDVKNKEQTKDNNIFRYKYYNIINIKAKIK